MDSKTPEIKASNVAHMAGQAADICIWRCFQRCSSFQGGCTNTSLSTVRMVLPGRRTDNCHQDDGIPDKAVVDISERFGKKNRYGAVNVLS